MKRLHYVYYLYKGKKLVYVGRSVNPNLRKVAAERRYECKLRLIICLTTFDFAEAASTERAEIERLRPIFNKIVNSSSGMLDYKHNKESRRQMSITKKLNPMPEVSRQKLRVANTGKHLSTSTKEKLRQRFVGIPLGEEHKRKIGDAQLGVRNHMFGKKRTKAAKRKTSETLAALWSDPVRSAEVVAKRNETKRINK